MTKTVFISLLLASLSAFNAFGQVQSANEVDGTSMYIQGMEAFQLGNLEQAEEYLLGAFEKLGPLEGLNFALGDLYLSLNNYAKASLYLNQALKIDPKNKWYSLKLIEVYQRNGQIQRSIDELDKLVDLYPNDDSLKWKLIDTYTQIGNYQTANKMLLQLLNTGADPSQVHLALFNNFEALNKKDSALVHLQKLHALNPYDLTTDELLKAYSTNLNGSEPITSQGEKKEYTPQEVISRTQALLNESQYDSAKSFLLNQFRLNTKSDYSYSIRIAEYLKSLQDNYSEKPRLAEITHEFYSEVFNESPQNSQIYALGGEFYATIFQYNRALELLNTSIALSSTNEAAWRLKLQILSTQNDFEAVIEQGRVANKALPDDAYIQFFVGSAFLFQNNSNTAIEWLERASRAPAQRPFKSLVFITLGDVHASLGNNDLASRNFELALRYDPNNNNGKVRYAKYLIHQQSDLQKAEQLLQEALAGLDGNSDIKTVLGELYFSKNDYEQSVETLLNVVEGGEASAHTFEILGNAYEQLNNLTEAKKWWRQALLKDPSLEKIQKKIQSL
jgi:tetratricopeptide (TPR) repeat protein